MDIRVPTWLASVSNVLAICYLFLLSHFCLGMETIEVKEGDEPDEFWALLGGKTEYYSVKEGEIAPRDPRLFQCSNATGSFKVEEVCETIDG